MNFICVARAIDLWVDTHCACAYALHTAPDYPQQQQDAVDAGTLLAIDSDNGGEMLNGTFGLSYGWHSLDHA